MASRFPTREADEMHLDWLRRREAGESSTEIARRWGVTAAQVRIATTRIWNEMNTNPGAVARNLR